MADRESTSAISRTQSIEVQQNTRTSTEKEGWFSLFGSSKKQMEKEDMIRVEEADEDDLEEKYSYGIRDDQTFHTAEDNDRYNVNALRVPSMLDRAEKAEANGTNLDDIAIDDDEESILEDPYSEIRPKEEMKDEEEEATEDKSIERKRFFMCLTSKMFFLLGSMLFLVLASHDYQRVKAAEQRSIDMADLEDVAATDDDVDPFVIEMDDITTGANFEEQMAMAEAEKDERAGGALTTHEWGTRRRTLSFLRGLATNWYTQYWADLPDDVMYGATLLGYDQATWDTGESVYTDRLHWDKLTPGQQAAATLVFNYDQETWDDYVDRFLANLANEPVPPSTPAPTATPMYSPTDPSTEEQQQEEGIGEDVTEGESSEVEVESGTPESEADDASESDGTESGGGETGDADESAGDTGETGDQGSDGNEESDLDNEGQDQADEGRGSTISAFNNGYSINIIGKYPPEERGQTYKILYICAALCCLVVGMLDAIHQQLAFHAVMIAAGIMGLVAGAFTESNEKAFHVCHSLSTHLFLLQAMLLIYSRLLLTYENSVRRTLNFADSLFAVGSVMNVVVSYTRHSDTSLAMTKVGIAAYVFWCIAAIIYVATTIMFWLRRNRTERLSKGAGTSSMATRGRIAEAAESFS